MTCVLTSYGPFAREHNSSGEAARRARECLEKEGIAVVCREIDTAWGSFATDLDALVRCYTPKVIVSLGESAKITVSAVELVGYNKREGIDADGARSTGAVDENGPSERRAPAENKAAAQATKQSGHQLNLSYDAGRYLCNAALYTNLGFLENGRVDHAAFVHVPAREKGAAQTQSDGETVAAFVKNLVGNAVD
ncbi:Pyrrolidone-carboxylate peptidase [Corynebacterium oculi]|uniref:Pyrrolidone-carboxylate peptidase n=1 Tax=Corynebacterium oculi TaxID=1544416 RepID=A0A0N8VZP0_9CORY|nr:hypothetical protein [Corynebacterium oculi]KQB84434.1 Pyrrolidone-carboxylate peptidase [Corynebacterium oculi]